MKLKADYGAVLHMPVLKEGKDRVPQHPGSMQGYAQPGWASNVLLRLYVFALLGFMPAYICFKNNCSGYFFCPHFFLLGEDPDYLITGTHAYPSGPGKGF